MAVIIKIPHMFRQFIDDAKEISVGPGTISEIINEVKKKYPDLAKQILDNKGHIKGHLKLCINSGFINNPSEYLQIVGDEQILKLIIPITGG
ncbi:MAG: MoaD/ThiS family protein [Actinobacteria bacterium]|nr:MoaD/ThiS family protein [Actinomycetota bacterium]